MTQRSFETLKEYLRHSKAIGVIYTTSSHTPEHPRCRIILILDRMLDRTDRIQAAIAMRARIDSALLMVGCDPVGWDRSCDRPEQPLFLPLEGAHLEFLEGQPLAAEELLEGATIAGAGKNGVRHDIGSIAKQLENGAGNHPTMVSAVAKLVRAGLSDAAIQAAMLAETWGRDMPDSEVQRAIDGARAKLDSGEWRPSSLSASPDDFSVIGDHFNAPEPLRRPTPPPTPYPLDALGDVLQPAAEAVRRVIQAPDAIIGGALLAATSLAVQAQADVHIDGRVLPLSLWLLSVADSGERKSAVDAEAMHAAREHEAALHQTYTFELELHAADMSEWEAKRDAVKSEAKKAKGESLADKMRTLGSPPPAPLLPRVTAADFTAEGLFKLLSVGVPSIGAFTDEAALVFGGHGMAKETVMRTAGTLCKLWDNGTLDRVRSGDGALKLYGRRLALHLLAQPVIAEAALSDAVLAGQGFLARCLLAWPEGTAGGRTYRPEALRDDAAMQRLKTALLERHRLPLPLATGERQMLRPRALRLADDAKVAWIDLHDAVEVGMRPDGQYAQVKPWASKAPEQALRIAGVLALLADADAVTIDNATMQRAIKLARWYLDEALRLAGSADLSPVIKDAEALLRWLHSSGRKFIYSRAVLQYGPIRIRERSAFQRAIGELVRAGWAVPVEGGMLLDGAQRRQVWRIIDPELV